MESLFDVGNIEGVECSDENFFNLRKYRNGTMYSPVYGGFTSKVEFEVLTGFSNAFFLDNVVPYNVYFKNREYMDSIVWEFKNNGYETMAVHPNDKKFYNRDSIYKAFGFDEFYDIAEFSKENINGKYISDAAFADKIIEKAEYGEKPKFIFGISMENHGNYVDKYKDLTVTASAINLSENQNMELRNYIQGVKSGDEFIGKMIDFVDKRERPTLIYFFGDHLPALKLNNRLGIINDEDISRQTPIIMYSNYKEIAAVDTPISPNQLAVQILKNSGINYSDYFDYIYNIREKYPIIAKNKNDDFASSEEIKNYSLIQYDLMFGERYLKK